MNDGMRAKPGEGSLFERRNRWIVRRLFKVERWRIVTHLRAFKGNGLANFEFEFRLGFPRHSRNAARQIEELFDLAMNEKEADDEIERARLR